MEKKFVTLISCMDGRIQLVSNKYMQRKYNALYVDTITEAGPCKIITDNKISNVIENIKVRVDISINNHYSKVIGVVGHFDCAAIQDSDSDQKQFVRNAVLEVKCWYPKMDVLALWVNDNLEVEEL